MKAFSKIGSWIIGNKVVSIVIVAVLAIGITCGVVLPIALHEHTYSQEWSSDAENHWHDATCKHTEEKSDLGAHTYDNACDTTCNVCQATRDITHDHASTLTMGESTHYYLCSVCNDRKDETAHVFDKEVAESEYLKAEATTTTKAQYYKSCVCGAKSTTEFFETNKTLATLTNIQDLSKTYDKVELANPTYTTNSDGVVKFEWYEGETLLTEKPVNAGTYKVKVIVAESVAYTGVSEEKEFTISKVLVNIPTLEKVYDGYGEFEFVFEGPAGEEIDCLVDIDNKNAGTYTDVAISNKSVSSENYEITATTVSATILRKDLDVSGLVFEKEYDGNVHISKTVNGVNNEKLTIKVEMTHTYPTQANYKEVNIITENDFAVSNYTYSGKTYHEYTEEIKANAKILKKDIDGSTISFEREYDGTDIIDVKINGVGEEYLLASFKMNGKNVYKAPHVPTNYIDNSMLLTRSNGFEIINYTIDGLAPDTYLEENAPTKLKIIPYDVDVSDIPLQKEFDGSRYTWLKIYGVGEEWIRMNIERNGFLPSSSFHDIYLYPYEGFNVNNYTFSGMTQSEFGEFLKENFKVVKKKISNLELYITVETYDSGTLYLLAKDLGLESPSAMIECNITDANYQDFSAGFEVSLNYNQQPKGQGYETISFVDDTYDECFEFVTTIDENGYEVIGTLTCVEECDVQFNGYCACGTIHEAEELTFPYGESIGANTVINCGQGYEGGRYMMDLEGGTYEIIPSDNFAYISVYRSTSRTVRASGSRLTITIPQGKYYIVVGVGSDPGPTDYITINKIECPDVGPDGSCDCGNRHVDATLTFTGGEAVGNSATIDCDSTYEGGIYEIALEGGTYEFLGSDQFFNISGIYDEDGNKVADSIGTHKLPAGTYYFNVYVGSIPSSDTIWVRKMECDGVLIDGSCDCGNIHSAVATSFETAYEFDCQEGEFFIINTTSTQKIYLKIMGGENSLMNDFYIYTPDGSTATFTYEIYSLTDTSTPKYEDATHRTEFYKDVCVTSDEYLVITIVTGGGLVLKVEK